MKYYFLKTDTFPSEIANSESVILIQDEDSPPELEVTDLEFISTLVVKTDDIEETLLHVQDWWGSVTSGKLELELLTEKISMLNSDQQALVSGLEIGQWSLKDNFLAYPKGNSECLEYAKSIIVESEFSSH